MVEVLIGSGYSSFKGRVLRVSMESLLMSVVAIEDNGEETWYEAVIRLDSISSIYYKKELQNFSTEKKEDEQGIRT